MKKVIAIALSVALVFALSATAYAAITESGGTDSAPVYATYVAGSAAETVYSVEIAWGSMEFTYTDAGAGTWSGSNHAYTDTTEAEWTSESGTNVIRVTNHSNTAITAALAYESNSAYQGVAGTFDNEALNLATAEGTAVNDAPTASASLTLRGELDSGAAEKVAVGTVTVTITGAEAAAG